MQLKRKREADKLLNYFIALLIAIVFITGCNVNANKVYDAIKPEFYKDYPNSTIIQMVPERRNSLAGFLGYEVNMRIRFKREGNNHEETIVWHCFCHTDKGWIIKNKAG